MKTEYLLHREVGHVLAALMPQNRLIARVCLHTGLRVGDVVALRTQLLQAFIQTLQMVGIAGSISLLLGIPFQLVPINAECVHVL